MKTFMREATRDDGLRLDAFLKRHNETSMFMRSNLREYGFCDFKNPYAMRYFLRERGGAIQGVGAGLVKRVEGSYTCVVGLPLAELIEDIEGLMGPRWLYERV